MPRVKPKTCHKCGQMYTGWRCPRCYRKAHKSHSSSRSRNARRRFGMAGTPLGTSLVSVTPVTAPIWEADPFRFWSEIVESIRLAHNASGQQFVTARWYGGAGCNERAHTFALDDVRDIVTRYYILPDLSKQNQPGVKA